MTVMKRLILICIAVLSTVSSFARVVLPPVFSDNMVLQQNTEVAIWGWTSPGQVVKVSASWTRQVTKVKASSDGKFMARIPTCAAGGPYTVTINDGDKTVLSNVLLGEVWFCGGQSNMEMPMSGFTNQPVEGASRVIATARPSRNIRMFTAKRKASLKEEDSLSGDGWQANTPEAVAKTSAVAYFFAQMLEQVLDVPVGLLISDWGGTPIEAWMDRSSIEKDFSSEFDISYLDGNVLPELPSKKPCTLFNGQIAPLIPFTFKGMIWYQGCDNRNRAEQYTRLQPSYVRMMRERFNNPDAPFYFVQLAPHKYSNPDEFTLGYMCEAQQKTLEMIPNSGMAATLDIGEFGTIHPCKKQQVGERLALLALQDTYGFKGFDAHSPHFKSMETKDGNLVLHLSGAEGGLAPIGIDLPGFEVAGVDRVFHPATARVRSFGVVVSCPQVEHPVAVRYCFRNWATATLFSNYGIPVGPFRTDDWDDIKE